MGSKFKIGDKVRVCDVAVGTEVQGMPGDVVRFMGPMRLTVGRIGYIEQVSDRGSVSGRRWPSPQERYDALVDGRWGTVIWDHFGTGMVVRGKHPGLSREEILERLGCASKECMARFKEYSEGSFMVSYFTD